MYKRQREWKDEVATLDAEFQKWHDDVSGVVQGGIGVNMEARHREVHGGQTPCAGDPGGKSPEEVSTAVVELNAEIASIARDVRTTHVGFAVQPSTAAGCVASVTSSAMFKQLPVGGLFTSTRWVAHMTANGRSPSLALTIHRPETSGVCGRYPC